MPHPAHLGISGVILWGEPLEPEKACPSLLPDAASHETVALASFEVFAKEAAAWAFSFRSASLDGGRDPGRLGEQAAAPSRRCTSTRPFCTQRTTHPSAQSVLSGAQWLRNPLLRPAKHMRPAAGRGAEGRKTALSLKVWHPGMPRESFSRASPHTSICPFPLLRTLRLGAQRGPRDAGARASGFR